MPSLSSKWKVLLKLVGPIFFIFLIMKVVDPRATVNILKRIEPAPAMLSVLLFPVLISALTIRWSIIFRSLEVEFSFKSLFQIYYTSWFLGLIPVIGVSQLSKFVYLREDKGSPGPILASITLDKIFDTIGHLLLGFFALAYFPGIFFKNGYFWFFLTIGLLSIITFLLYWNKVWQVITNFLKNFTSKRIQQIGKNLEIDLSSSWSSFNLKFFTLSLGTSIIIGILRALALFLLAISLDIHASFGFIIACRALIGIVNLIPVTVNGLGTRDAVLLLTLPMANASKEAAVALSALVFLWTLSFRLSGIIFWLKRPLPLRGFKFKSGCIKSKSKFAK